MPAEPADRIHLALVDMLGEGIDRSLAHEAAQDEAEGRRLDSTLARIADLEERATEALTAGREELATEAAEAIAMMEADRDAIRQFLDERLANSRLMVLDAGHFAWEEVPTEYAAIILDSVEHNRS